jgi:hypothetical protein
MVISQDDFQHNPNSQIMFQQRFHFFLSIIGNKRFLTNKKTCRKVHTRNPTSEVRDLSMDCDIRFAGSLPVAGIRRVRFRCCFQPQCLLLLLPP